MSNTVADRLAKKTRKKAPAKQVRLKLVYVDFWSAVKFSFLVSMCLAIVGIVTAILVYVVPADRPACSAESMLSLWTSSVKRTA